MVPLWHPYWDRTYQYKLDIQSDMHLHINMMILVVEIHSTTIVNLSLNFLHLVYMLKRYHFVNLIIQSQSYFQFLHTLAVWYWPVLIFEQETTAIIEMVAIY
jgi:hypothetical protein